MKKFLLIISAIFIVFIIYYICLENRDIKKVDIEIKEGTLTETSATVVITDHNIIPYNYYKYFLIEKYENDKWQFVYTLNTVYENGGAFTPVPTIYYDTKEYSVGNNRVLEMEQDWSEIYGKLEKGKYRLKKYVVSEPQDYNDPIIVEFDID